MCFVFRSRGTSRAKAALWHVLVVKRLGRAVQFLRQAQHFVNLKVQISWQAGKALCEPQSAEQHFVNLSGDFVAGTTLCEPQSADFVAGAALYKTRSADVVAGASLNLTEP